MISGLLAAVAGLSAAAVAFSVERLLKARKLEKRLKELARLLDKDGQGYSQAVMEGFDLGRSEPGPGPKAKNPYMVPGDEKPLYASGYALGVCLGSAHFHHLEALTDSMLRAVEDGFTGKEAPVYDKFRRFWEKGKEMKDQAVNDTRKGFNGLDEPLYHSFSDLGKELKAFRG